MPDQGPGLLKKVGGCLSIFAILLGPLVWGEQILDLFRLSGEDTVYEFMTADLEDQVDFLMRACNDGKCITQTDWACGFFLSQEGRFSDCFTNLVSKAKPWVRLDVIRKSCGRRFMEFQGEAYGDPARCQDLGGEWGVKKKGPRVPL